MTVLGLDIGGANLKASTADRSAVSNPFALWKQPDRLPAALAALIEQFPDAKRLAVTMTGELCDCYETKREGVSAILDAVEFAAKGRPTRVWSTEGRFLEVSDARRNPLAVAAANWHATATYVGRFARGPAILIDVGSTTTDIIPISSALPCSQGKTDPERLASGELLYTGTRRTPICALLGEAVASEFFATTKDAYLLLGAIEESETDCDTADSRPATLPYAHARMSRMLCGDPEITPSEATRHLAERVFSRQTQMIEEAAIRASASASGIITAGSGEFLALAALKSPLFDGAEKISLGDKIGPAASSAAAAFALAVLASERPDQ